MTVVYHTVGTESLLASLTMQLWSLLRVFHLSLGWCCNDFFGWVSSESLSHLYSDKSQLAAWALQPHASFLLHSWAITASSPFLKTTQPRVPWKTKYLFMTNTGAYIRRQERLQREALFSVLHVQFRHCRLAWYKILKNKIWMNNTFCATITVISLYFQTKSNLQPLH